MKSIPFACAFSMILCHCEQRDSTTKDHNTVTDRSSIAITSVREPKSDDDALKLARIKMTPAPEVIYRLYEAGMDDNMKLVIRFPANQTAHFWAGGPWLQKDAVVSSGNGAKGEAPLIPHLGAPAWVNWKSSVQGYSAEASLPDGESARVYLSEDQEPGFVHAFIFWHET